jgi:hypothetical protein
MEITYGHYDKANVKRSHETMSQEFITKPGDKFIVKLQGGLSSSIPLQVVNEKTGEDFYLGMKNCLAAWKELVKIDNIGARSVVVETDGGEVPYKESLPFKARNLDKAIA